jgi:hypothetical protein
MRVIRWLGYRGLYDTDNVLQGGEPMSYTTDSKYPTKQMADVLQKSLLQS